MVPGWEASPSDDRLLCARLRAAREAAPGDRDPARGVVRECVAPLATTDPVVTELLAGARDEAHATNLRRMLAALEHRPALGMDFQEAARIHRACRAAGETVRSLMDCLVAAVALREGLTVLARDRDFEAISRRTGLALEG